MSEREIDGILIAAFAFLGFAAFFFALTIDALGRSNAKAWGWRVIASVAGLAAATWRAREGGGAISVMLFGGLGFLAGYVVLAGAETRVRLGNALFDRRFRTMAGSDPDRARNPQPPCVRGGAKEPVDRGDASAGPRE